MKKRILSILLTLALLVTLFPLTTITAHAAPVSGQCGDNASYTLFDNGTLVISGSGVVDTAAWEDEKDRIVEVEVSGPSELTSYLFQGYPNLRRVVLGDSVETIGALCFAAETYQTSALESVEFGRGIRTIGNSAFYGARNMTQVIIHDLDAWCTVDIQYSLTNSEIDTADSPLCYGADLLLDGAPVTEVVFPDGIERIGGFAFAYCKSLEKVTIPASVKSIGPRAFYETPNLSSVTFLGHAPEPEFYLWEGRISYASGIFADDSGGAFGQLLYIHHPEGDETYTNRIRDLYSTAYSAQDEPGEDPNEDWPDIFLSRYANNIFSRRVRWPEPDPNLIAHGACGDDMTWTLDKEGTMLISGTGEMNAYSCLYPWVAYDYEIKSLFIDYGVTSIEDYAFIGCRNMTDVSIPPSVTTIGEAAFCSCDGLKDVSLPYGITTIAGDLFNACDGLEHVTIPDSVRYIENNAFFHCCNLKEIEIPANVISISEQSIGYTFNGKMEDFVITGHDQTEAQRYAEDNGFTFINLDKPYADYSKVEAAIAKVPKDLTPYTDDSVKKLNDALAAVKEGMTNTDQPTVDGWAKAIEEAIAGLIKKQVLHFNDVNPSAWYYDTVYAIAGTLNAKGHPLMSGYSNGSGNFGPADPLTRQDFAVILYRLADEPDVEPIENPFKDTNPKGYYYTCVVWAKANDVIAGYNDGRFGVGDKITREQVATILYRFAKDYMGLQASETGDLTKFSDGNAVSSWAKEALTWATGAGIITGKAGGTLLDARGNAARAEIGAMILRFITYMENAQDNSASVQ